MKHKLFKLMAKLLGKKEFLGEFLGEFGTRIKWRRKVFLEMPDSEYVTNTLFTSIGGIGAYSVSTQGCLGLTAIKTLKLSI